MSLNGSICKSKRGAFVKTLVNYRVENEIRNGAQSAAEIGRRISVQAGFGAPGKVVRRGSRAVQRPGLLHQRRDLLRANALEIPFPRAPCAPGASPAARRFPARRSDGSVTLPSFKSLSTGLPSCSGEAVKSRTSSTSWNASPAIVPVVGHGLLARVVQVSEDRAQPRASREQARRLPRRQFDGVLLGQIHAPELGQVAPARLPPCFASARSKRRES
jgi:hypothetical protein